MSQSEKWTEKRALVMDGDPPWRCIAFARPTLKANLSRLLRGDMEGNGKFGRAALAISLVTSATLLAMVALALVLAFTGHGTLRVNYIIGTTILICCLFELVAIALGVVGLFEGCAKKLAAWVAISLSLICFVTILTVILMGAHHTGSPQPVSALGVSAT